MFVDSVMAASMTPADARAPAARSSIVPAPTAAAFAAALAEELAWVDARLIRLQDGFESALACGRGSEGVTLLALEAHVQVRASCPTLGCHPAAGSYHKCASKEILREERKENPQGLPVMTVATQDTAFVVHLAVTHLVM
jgi:hypothetical protein